MTWTPTAKEIAACGDVLLEALVMCSLGDHGKPEIGDLVMVSSRGLDWERVGYLMESLPDDLDSPIVIWSVGRRVVRWQNASARRICSHGDPIRSLPSFPPKAPSTVAWAIAEGGWLGLFVDARCVAKAWTDGSKWHACSVGKLLNFESEHFVESGALDAIVRWAKEKGIVVPKCPVELRTEKPPYPMSNWTPGPPTTTEPHLFAIADDRGIGEHCDDGHGGTWQVEWCHEVEPQSTSFMVAHLPDWTGVLVMPLAQILEKRR